MLFRLALQLLHFKWNINCDIKASSSSSNGKQLIHAIQSQGTKAFKLVSFTTRLNGEPLTLEFLIAAEEGNSEV